MRSASRSHSPVRVSDVLIAALPALEERLLAERIRLGWRAAVGAELARRSRPGELKAGTLTVAVDIGHEQVNHDHRHDDGEAGAQAHVGRAVYPTPRTVWMRRDSPASSVLRRR